MPFAPRSFGAGRRPLVKPSSAAMQQFRGGSPSVAPVPLRMPARPPVANRMQQYANPSPPTQPGGVGMSVPQNPNDGMSIGSDWAHSTPMPKPVMTEAPVRQIESYPMMNDPSTGRPYGQSGPYDPTPMPKPVMTEAPAQAAPSGLASFLQYQNSKPGGGVGMSMPHNPNETGMTMGAFKRGGQVQAYAKGGRVMAKPVAKKAVKAAPAKTASRGDGIAQRGRTKGTMR